MKKKKKTKPTRRQELVKLREAALETARESTDREDKESAYRMVERINEDLAKL